MTKFFDLHCHSSLSDGTSSPTELVDLAIEAGLSGLSITDHDVIDGFVYAEEYAKEQKIKLLPGVEISCHYQNRESVHILGYAFNPKDLNFIEFCTLHQARRVKRAKEMLQRLTALGYPVTVEEVFLKDAPTKTIGRPHIAQALIARGYCSSIQEAFQKFLGSKAPCYVAGERWSVQEAIDMIHKAGGLAVLAHPHLLRKESLIRQLLAFPFDGIEVYYARFSESECRRWLDIANSKKWYVTGGSDFHGGVKPESRLGQSAISEEYFTPIYEHYLRLQK